MPFRVTCPGCKTACTLPDDARQKRYACPKCKQPLAVTTTASPPAANPRAAAPPPRAKPGPVAPGAPKPALPPKSAPAPARPSTRAPPAPKLPPPAEDDIPVLVALDEPAAPTAAPRRFELQPGEAVLLEGGF